MQRRPGRSEPLALDIVDDLTRFGAAYTRWVRSCIPNDGVGGMTAPRLSALGVLATQGRQMIMAELADRLGVTSRNVTVLIDGLEKDGLVRRVRHPTDRRATMVEVTEVGYSRAKSLIDPHREAVATLFDALSTDERQALHASLCKLNERFGLLGLGPVGADLNDANQTRYMQDLQ